MTERSYFCVVGEPASTGAVFSFACSLLDIDHKAPARQEFTFGDERRVALSAQSEDDAKYRPAITMITGADGPVTRDRLRVPVVDQFALVLELETDYDPSGGDSVASSDMHVWFHHQLATWVVERGLDFRWSFSWSAMMIEVPFSLPALSGSASRLRWAENGQPDEAAE